MIKEFSKEGQFECGLSDLVKGKVCALVPVYFRGKYHCLGLAVANEPGYYQIPFQWCHSDNREELERHAADLNKELFNLGEKEAMMIVASSMFKKGGVR